MFRGNAKGNSKSSAWNKLFHFFQMHRDEFLTHYHRRSNVESTFSAMKRKFGAILRSKTPVAQRSELPLKALCHNIVCVISLLLGVDRDDRLLPLQKRGGRG